MFFVLIEEEIKGVGIFRTLEEARVAATEAVKKDLSKDYTARIFDEQGELVESIFAQELY